MFIEFRSKIALTLTPSYDVGQLEVRLNGETLFDRRNENNVFPNMDHLNEWKAQLRVALENAGARPD
jgi:hypothetical protein